MSDPFNLERFVEAQAPIYDQALCELRAGEKKSHWMWFIFPQLDLGRSPMAKRYAISGRDEARAYLNHPVLGPRLRECVAAINALSGRTALEIFGDMDRPKLKSSLTLFGTVAPDEPAFAEALDKYFQRPDRKTLELLG